ncbi:MAG: hypothetical protein AAF351_13695 [Pseudomonadota bacterium]
MDSIADALRNIHVIFGFLGLAAFWIPIFAKKGAVNHVRFGKFFVWSAYIVLAGAALALTLRVIGYLQQGITISTAPAGYSLIIFLGYLTLVTFVSVRQGMQSLQHKKDQAALRTPANKAMAYSSIAASVFIIGYALLLKPDTMILLLALSPIGFAGGFGVLNYMNKEWESPRAWFYEHLGSMLGAGIAFHTAFAVFGISRIWDIGLSGWVAIIPWVLPSVIGIPASVIWARHYRIKFREIKV